MSTADAFRAVDRQWIETLVLKLWRRFRERNGITYMHCEDAVASALANTFCSEASSVKHLDAYVMRAASNAILDMFKRVGDRTNERTVLSDHVSPMVLDGILGDTRTDDALAYLIDTAEAEQLAVSLREAIAKAIAAA